MPELDARVTALENIMLPIARIFDLNDASLRPPNHYGDWLAVKAKEHSYYQTWTQIDKKSLDYLYARLESIRLLMKAQWAMSKTWDYMSDDKSLREKAGGNKDGGLWINYRENMPKLRNHEVKLIMDINRRLDAGEKTVLFDAYRPKLPDIPKNYNMAKGYQDWGFY